MDLKELKSIFSKKQENKKDLTMQGTKFESLRK